MQAEATLQFSPRAAARDVLGLLRSATANAKENHDIDKAELVIDHCYADEDRTLKRFKPRARGRASSIHKRMCHVTIVLRHVAVAEQRDISAAQATIAAESRRARTRRVPGDSPRPPPRRPSRGARGRGDRPQRRPRHRRPGPPRTPQAAAAADGDEPRRPRRRGSRGPSPPRTTPPRRPRRRRRGRGRPKAPRKKPAAKPTEPARRPRTMRPRRPPTKGTRNGSEDSPGRLPHRDHSRLEVQLVLREGVRRVPDRGRAHPRSHPRQALARRPLGHPHPQGLPAHHDRHLHGASRHRDREVGQ